MRVLLSTLCLLALALLFHCGTSSAMTFKLEHTWKNPTGVSSVAFSPDSSRLYYGTLDGNLNVWEIKQNVHRRLWQSQHHEEITPMTFSRSGRFLAFGIGDNVAVWDVRWNRLQWLHHQTQSDQIMGLSFSPDGALLASSHYQSQGEGGVGGWSAWSTSSGHQLQAHQREMLDDVSNIVFSLDNRTLVIQTEDGFYFWKRNSRGDNLKSAGKKIGERELQKSRVARLLLVSTKSTSGEEATFLLTLLQGSRRFPTRRQNEQLEFVGGSPAFSPGRRVLALGGESRVVPLNPKQVSVWDLSRAWNRQKPVVLLPGMHIAQFSPKENWFVTGTTDPFPGTLDRVAGRVIRLWSYS